MQYVVHVMDVEYLTFYIEAPDPTEAERKVLNGATSDVVIASLRNKRVREIQSIIAKQ